MWNERYTRPGYVFGTNPNVFLASCAPFLQPGQAALCPADGEGRNSCWLAGQGLDVTAFDASHVGLDKARRLADEKGVTVDYRLARIEDWDWTPDRFDVVAAIFIQFVGPDVQRAIFEGITRTLKPGGLVLLQGYRPKQIEYGTGGPKDPDMLYTRELLERAFAGFDIRHLAEHDDELAEGHGHSGMSALIDMIAQKPA